VVSRKQRSEELTNEKPERERDAWRAPAAFFTA
jgi:hypothetical protein